MIWGLRPFTLIFVLRLIADRASVLWGVALLAVLFVINGIYIITRGRMGPRLGKSAQPENVLSHPQRLAIAILYLVVGIGLMFLVFTRGVM